MFYGASLHPQELLLYSRNYQMVHSSFIDLHFPLSVPGRVSKNIVINPDSFATISYS